MFELDPETEKELTAKLDQDQRLAKEIINFVARKEEYQPGEKVSALAIASSFLSGCYASKRTDLERVGELFKKLIMDGGKTAFDLANDPAKLADAEREFAKVHNIKGGLFFRQPGQADA